MPKDNPFCQDGKWYWYDETASLSDPFDTREEAAAQLCAYITWMNEG